MVPTEHVCSVPFYARSGADILQPAGGGSIVGFHARRRLLRGRDSHQHDAVRLDPHAVVAFERADVLRPPDVADPVQAGQVQIVSGHADRSSVLAEVEQSHGQRAVLQRLDHHQLVVGVPQRAGCLPRASWLTSMASAFHRTLRVNASSLARSPEKNSGAAISDWLLPNCANAVSIGMR